MIMGKTVIPENHTDEDNCMDRKLEIKRLLIYLALSFGLTWIIFFAYIVTGHKWDGSNTNMEMFVGLGMLMPFAAHILTRIITKEGFAMTGRDSVMLGISFRDKKWKCYIFALFIPWLYFEVMHLLAIIFVPKSLDGSVLKNLGISKGLAFAYPIITIVSCAFASFAALGEEGGWRGYMMPKLLKLMSVPKAIIVGGVLWGIWHAPLTCVGHNYGTDYPGFPYVGILLMCIQCTLLGIMLTYITIKSQSVWPAAIMHSVNNGNPTILKFFINTDTFERKYPGPVFSSLLLAIPIIVIDVIIIMIAIRKNKVDSNM